MDARLKAGHDTEWEPSVRISTLGDSSALGHVEPACDARCLLVLFTKSRRAGICEWQRYDGCRGRIAATDLFVVPKVGFKLLCCLVFLAHGRRELVQHAVTAHPTAEWVARQGRAERPTNRALWSRHRRA